MSSERISGSQQALSLLSLSAASSFADAAAAQRRYVGQTCRLHSFFAIVGFLQACARSPTGQQPDPLSTSPAVAPVQTGARSAAATGSSPVGTSEQVTKDRTSCDSGDHEKGAFVGWAYYTGEGAPVDHKRAYDFLKLACDHGVQTGCVPMGYMYQRGDVVPKDLERAIALFKPACEQGKLDVCIGLGELYEKDKGDAASAVTWFHKACAAGNADGCAAEQRLRSH